MPPFASNVSGTGFVSGRICKQDKCGQWINVESNLWMQGMFSVDDGNATWTGSSTFKLEFDYPTAAAGTYEEPDFFRVLPVNGSSSTPIDVSYASATINGSGLYEISNINFNSYNTYTYQIQACRNDVGCGATIDVELGVSTGNNLNVEVFEDANTSRRYVFWDRPSDEAAQGITYYEIEVLVDESCPIGATNCTRTRSHTFGVSSTLPFVSYTLSQQGQADYIKVRACQSSGVCGDWNQDQPIDNNSPFPQALTRVSDPGYIWDEANNTFKLNWNYSNDVFDEVSNTGKPTKIHY